MLKKRILASSMASVMALSGVSLVAFADTKDYGEAVTKAELEEYVKSFDKFVADELDGYGTIQADYFRQAIDHANVVLGDSKAEAKDYTAAYQMIKAIKEKLVIKTNDELKALIKDNQAKYDGNNILNELYQDNIYKVSTYETFTSAFDDAQFFVDSGDSRGITDSYLALESAVKGLEELTSITKADFRTALAKYEQLELSMRSYETWRRGTISVAPLTGAATDSDAKKIVSNKAVVTMDQLIELVYGNSQGTFAFLDNGVWDKTTLKFDTAGKQLIGNWTVAATLKDDIKAVGDEFAEAKGVVKTTKPEIVDAYKAALEAVDVFNSWTADNYNSGSKSSCASLEKKFHNQLVETYNIADIEVVLNTTASAAAGAPQTEEDVELGSGTTVTANITYNVDKHTLTASKALYIVTDKSTGLIKTNGASLAVADFYATSALASTAVSGYGTGYQVQTISANTDMLKYFGYTVDDDSSDLDIAFNDLYGVYLGYTFPADAETAKTLIDTIADGKTIAKCSGSTAEWTLIWRKLAYALDDAFPTPVAGETITLKMLEAKIAEAYDLCDKTGDAALFAAPYAKVVADRQDSNAFVKEAKATTGYKDGDVLTDAACDVATQYAALKDSVAELNKWYNDFKYSYDEVRATIAEVANAIDKGDVKGDKLTAALTACAYDLSVLVPSDVVGGTGALDADTNLAFDADRTFQPVNRLKTDKTITDGIALSTEEKALVASYAALIKAYADAKADDAETGYDLSGDGIVDFGDVQILFDDFVMKGEYNAKYDFNSDKLVDFADVQIFFDEYVMG
ncbi:MAG: hypothetical protein ACI4QY_05900 [Oscillospiraceae bacterium]